MRKPSVQNARRFLAVTRVASTLPNRAATVRERSLPAACSRARLGSSSALGFARSPTSQAFCLLSCVSSHLSVRRRNEEGFNPDVDCKRGGLQTRPDRQRVARLAT